MASLATPHNIIVTTALIRVLQARVTAIHPEDCTGIKVRILLHWREVATLVLAEQAGGKKAETHLDLGDKRVEGLTVFLLTMMNCPSENTSMTCWAKRDAAGLDLPRLVTFQETAARHMASLCLLSVRSMNKEIPHSYVFPQTCSVEIFFHRRG